MSFHIEAIYNYQYSAVNKGIFIELFSGKMIGILTMPLCIIGIKNIKAHLFVAKLNIGAIIIFNKKIS